MARAAATMVVWGLIGLLSACGGSNASPTSPTPSPAPGGDSNTITITASGVSPRELRIRAGSRAMFVNNDSRAHDMSSDPHPEHLDCPEINQVGFLQPGQSRETGNFVIARTCGYHDHNQPDTESLQGRIVITQ